MSGPALPPIKAMPIRSVDVIRLELAREARAAGCTSRAYLAAYRAGRAAALAEEAKRKPLVVVMPPRTFLESLVWSGLVWSGRLLLRGPR